MLGRRPIGEHAYDGGRAAAGATQTERVAAGVPPTVNPPSPAGQPSAFPQTDRSAWVALLLATLSLATGFAVWSLLAPLAPLFRELWSRSATQTGVLVAVPVILGSITRIPLGIVTDRFGGRTVLSAFLCSLTIPLLLAGFADGFATLLGVAFILGVAGAIFAVGVPFVVRWFPPERQGLALGIYGMGNIGSAVTAFVATPVAGAYGWPPDSSRSNSRAPGC